MDISTGEQREVINGLNRNEQLLLALFRGMSQTDQSYMLRLAEALAKTGDAEQR
ncbi:hypothetical protein ACMYUJ_17225 [Stutzerimonas zhaodongensis]|uniref:hypothetical protein n=1 Tax=Stutzerimonas zhaodongensis TaxID=1176257 RepID=UPI0039EF4865